jgi:DNA invertase Pin-like site-specific DNA recombinase
MPPLTGQRAAIYARVSTADQTCENQLLELRRYCEARGWQASEYVDEGNQRCEGPTTRPGPIDG